MLQQTQVSRVLPKYAEFLGLFPDIATLSEASTGTVLRAWKGLGYNRRALCLKRTADYLQLEHAGEFPREVSDLQKLPGVGPYTARAVACFSFEAHVAVVETNVRRALDWFIDPTLNTRLSETAVNCLATSLVPAGQAWLWNQAMIDFGALYVPARPRTSQRDRPLQRFEETDRFWRGRIVDVLRVAEEPVSLETMLAHLPPTPDKRRVRALLAALSDEGIVRYDASRDQSELGG